MKHQYYLLFIVLTIMPLASKSQLNTTNVNEKITHLSFEGTSVKATLIRSGGDAILVDAMYDSLALEIKKYIESEGLTLTHIINTHYHGDHSSGNSYFKGVDIIAHTNTLTLMEKKAPYGPSEPFADEDKPNLLFDDQMTLNLNRLEIQMIHFGSGHTSGDIVVYLPENKLVILGDLMLDAKLTLPFFPNPEEGVDVLKKISSLIDDNTKVITGHGSIGTKKDILALIAIIDETIAYSKAGKDAEKFPDEWKKWNSAFMTMANWLKMLDKIYE